MTKYNDKQTDRQEQEETALTSDACANVNLGQADAPADRFADQDEYIDEP